MLLIIKSLVFGTLSFAVRRLGTSLILFAYLYVAHSKKFSQLENAQGWNDPHILLAAAVILAGIVLIAFRSAFTHYCQTLDAKALPRVDQFILAHLNRYDLTIMNLRGKSRAVLEASKAVLLMLLLALLCVFAARPLALILLVLIVLTLLLSWLVGRVPQEKANATTLSKLRYQPENYTEIMLVAGLIIGFLLITPTSGVINGTVLILMIARFGGALRLIATNIVSLLRWHAKDKLNWDRKRQAREKAAAKQAAREAAIAAKRRAKEEARAKLDNQLKTVA